ncbi:hypothetical protein A3F66_04855 [candidate division TM6 bacterium RIFCSPHIGHO2_12_FULL_32_22]|nr:MAG: hypothetical protein A3F66_04855 [candidate division TM6 bacterium RIFCSPHIGHO2_12_FULL_32_22]
MKKNNGNPVLDTFLAVLITLPIAVAFTIFGISGIFTFVFSLENFGLTAVRSGVYAFYGFNILVALTMFGIIINSFFEHQFVQNFIHYARIVIFLVTAAAVLNYLIHVAIYYLRSIF